MGHSAILMVKMAVCGSPILGIRPIESLPEMSHKWSVCINICIFNADIDAGFGAAGRCLGVFWGR
jgi:hypothetical protein